MSLCQIIEVDDSPVSKQRYMYVRVHVYVNLTHITTERGVRLCTGHTGWKELYSPALGIAQTTQHEPSIFLPPHNHITVLAHRTHTDTLTECKFLLRRNENKTT